MSATTLKVKAICLILLLGGQEAFRIQGAARTRLAVKNALGAEEAAPAGIRWNEASERCTWKITKPGCSGEGCKFRPLPLDTSLSESCRFSDSYMLSNASTRHQYVALAAEVLEEKSEKFKNGCADAKFWEVSKQLHCHRRAGRMLRSAELLSKAAEESGGTEQQKHAERALENIASAFGTDGQFLLQYKDKAKGDILDIAKDPTRKFRKMITTVSKLLTGSDDAKNEARLSIEKMPSKNVTKATKRDENQIKKVVKRLSRQYNLKDKQQVSKAWSDLDEFIPTETNGTESSSLLEAEGKVAYRGVSMIVVVIVLILILILILPGIGGGAIVGTLITVLVVVLVLILIIMLVRVLIGHIRGLGGDSRRRNNNRRGNRHR